MAENRPKMLTNKINLSTSKHQQKKTKMNNFQNTAVLKKNFHKYLSMEHAMAKNRTFQMVAIILAQTHAITSILRDRLFLDQQG